MKKPDIDPKIILIILMMIVIILCIVFRTYVMYKYGEVPISEIPAWAWWWMHL